MMTLNKKWLGEKERVTTRVTPGLKEWLVWKSKKDGITLSELLRNLVIEERRRNAVEWRKDYHAPLPKLPGEMER
jgi:hypothetical protein